MSKTACMGQDRLPELFRQSSLMMCALSREGHILDANESLCAFLGYERARVLGNRLSIYASKRQTQMLVEAIAELEQGAVAEPLFLDLADSDSGMHRVSVLMQRMPEAVYVTLEETGRVGEPMCPPDERSKSFETLARILRYQTRDTDRFYRFALAKAVELFSCEFGCLRVYHGAPEMQQSYVHPEDLEDRLKAYDRMDKGVGLWRHVHDEQEPLIINRFERFLEKRGLIPGREAARLKNLMMIPILHDGQLVASVALANRPVPFTERDMVRLDTVMSAVWSLVDMGRLSEKLRSRERSHRQLFQNMREGLAVHEMVYDADGAAVDYRFVEVNEGFFRESGLERQIMGGRLASEFYGDAPPPFIQEYEYVVRTGQPLQFEADYEPLGRVFHVSAFSPEPGRFAAVFFDRTKELEAKRQLKEEKELLATTLRSVGDGLIATDVKGYVRQINWMAQTLTGWPREDARGRHISEIYRLFDERTNAEIADPVGRTLRDFKDHTSGESVTLTAHDGTRRSISDKATPIKDERDRLRGVVLVFRDVSEQREHLKKIEYLSFHDALTGLYNRVFFEKELERLDTPRQLPMSVIMGDVNGLKLTNDIFGHRHGDGLLMSISDLLRRECRQEDILARWGGDEFVLLLPKTDAKTAEEIAERLMQSARSRAYNHLELSISIGVSTKKAADESMQDVLARAEKHMYRRKLLDKQSARSSIIKSLLETLDQKSHETHDHCSRLARMTIEMGRTMGIEGAQMDDLALFARLHDVGMVVVPDEIIRKPGELDDEEWTVMHQHSEAGYRICQSVPEVAHVARYVLAHHERLDGSGYPYGLQGEEVPLYCRILAVADAYDVMTRGRRYQPPRTHAQAVRELADLADVVYDAQVVSVFRSLYEGDPPSFSQAPCRAAAFEGL